MKKRPFGKKQEDVDLLERRFNAIGRSKGGTKKLDEMWASLDRLEQMERESAFSPNRKHKKKR